jgi:hypothetical protein
MAQMDQISKLLIVAGVVLIVAGVVWHFSGGKIPLFRLPGDIRIESENAKFYLHITSSIIISLILSAIGWFLRLK